MKRLLATLRCDLLLQFRNGFFYATAFVIAIWALLISRLHLLDTRPNLEWLLPPMVLDSLVINSFYFVGALVLLEKGEGTLEAQVVTPLRTSEYLVSKVITLTLLALLQNVIVVGLVAGVTSGMLQLIAGTVLASTFYVLLGFVAVARYNSINEYLLPSLLYVAVLLLPLLPYVNGWDGPLLYLHPLQAPLVVIQAAFQPVEFWRIMYGLLYAGLWIGLVYLFARPALRRFVIAEVGASSDAGPESRQRARAD